MILDNSILGIVTDGEDVLILYLLDGALDDVAATLISRELRLSGATTPSDTPGLLASCWDLLCFLWFVKILRWFVLWSE